MTGKVFVTVIEAAKLPKCDPYCIVAFDDGKEVGRTQQFDKDSNPVWNKRFTLELPTDYKKVTLQLTVMDKETMRKDLVVGTVSIPLAPLRDKEESNQWYPIVMKEKAKEQATLHVSIVVDSKDITPIVVQEDTSKASKEELVKSLDEVKNQLLESKTENAELVQEINALFGEMYYQFCHPKVLGHVNITIISGRDLPKKDIFGATAETLLKGTSDPYCKLLCGGKQAISTVKKANLNPDWNETFTLPVMHGGEELQIDIFDEDLIGRDEFMGQVIVPLGYLMKSDTPLLQNTYNLRPKKFQSESSAKKVKGTLSLNITYVPEKEVAEIEPTLVKRKSDLLEMAAKVKANLLERIAESNLEVDKARELVEEIETIFKPEFYAWCEPPKIGELAVKVVEAQGLAKKDLVGSSDPYVVLELDSQKSQTNVIKNNLNPKWENQKFTFDVLNLASTLHVTVLDHDNVGSPNFIGKAYLPLVPIYDSAKGGSVQNWYLLGPQKGTTKDKAKITGQVLLEFSYKEIAPSVPDTPKLGKDAVLAMVAKVKSKLIDTIKKKDEELEIERKFQQAVAELFSKEYNELCVNEQVPGGVKASGGPAILELAQSVKAALQKQLEVRTAALQEANNALFTVTNAVGKLYTTLCKPDPIATVGVTVIEARNLAKRDVIGSSDPYVTILVEGAKEQTEVKHNTLNPKWNKSFNFTLTRPASVFEVVLWDYDRVGASDHLGTVVIPVDDLVSGTVDKWYTLGQKRGKSKDKEEITGDVHLLFKYNALPKNEKKEDEKRDTAEVLVMVEEIQKAIQERLTKAEEELQQAHEFVTEIDNIFLKDYFTYCKPQKLADLVVHVVEARGLAKKDIVGSSDPYVVVDFEGKQQKTEIIHNNLNPSWKEGKFSFELTRLSSNITLTLYDHDTAGSDDFMGYISLPVTGGVTNVVEGTEAGKKKLDVWLPVGHRPSDPADVSGDLHLVVEFIPVIASDEQPSKAVRETTEVIKMVQTVREAYHTQIDTAVEEAKQAKEFVSVVDALFTPEYYEWCKPPAIAELVVQVNEARELIKADTFGSSDPYVTLEIENQTAKTVHIKNNLNPKWDNQVFTLPITKLSGSLAVHVFDYDAVGANDPLGSCAVSVRDILTQTLEGQQSYSVVLPLAWADQKIKKPISGSVSLTINFRPIKGEDIKREGKAYQKEVEERATAVKVELVKRARESGAMFGKLLQRIEKERPFATAPIPEGSLTVAITGARGLIAADIVSGTSDPYCIVRVGKVVQKTAVQKKTLEPQWKDTFNIPIINAATATLEVTVMDHDMLGSDDFLGYVSMPISLLEEGQPNQGWFKLQSYKKYKGKGEVYMEVTYTTQRQENLLIDFEADLAPQVVVPEIANPAAVVQALDEVFKAYEEKVKTLETALKGERSEKARVSFANQSLAAKLTSKILVGK